MDTKFKIAKDDNFNIYYNKLPECIKKKLKKQIRFLIQDPKHPSLNIHKFKSIKNLWEFYVDEYYRCLFSIEKNVYILKWVGTHPKMDKL